MATAHALPLARPSSNLRNYVLVTAAYWADTLTDGAVRMLVLLYFYQRGYTAIEVATLFLFYEVFGIVTNLVGGWMAARLGLKATLFAGLGTQVVALSMLALVQPEWLAVPYVMVAQALSGIAKDLTKMSSKSAIKFVVADDAQSTLFKWVAILTGLEERAQGRRVLRRRPPALPGGFSRGPVHPGGAGADRPDLDLPADEGRPRHLQQEGEVRPDVLEQPGRQRPRGGARLSVRLAGRVVRRGPAGLLVHGAGLDLLAGRRLHGHLDHRLRARAGQRPWPLAPPLRSAGAAPPMA